MQQAESLGSYGADIAVHYDRYTSAHAMVEAADRLNEAEATVEQYLLLVGGLRALASGEHASRSILDSYLLRAMALSGWAPGLDECARCGAPGPHDAFVAQLGGMVCATARRWAPPGSTRRPPRCCSRSWRGSGPTWMPPPPASSAAASGLIAAYAQWHLERGIRSLEHVAVRRARRPSDDAEAVHAPGCRRLPPDRLDGPVPAGVSRRASVPKHVAIVMDGNGRWANRRGLTRIEGHKAGEAALLDVVAGAIQAGVKHLSVYAFSTENWSRSPDEVRFLMGFNRDVLHRRRDQLNEWGVRVRWSGRRPRLWSSVIKELQYAERLTAGNDVLTLTMCVNYGGRVELVDAMRAIGDDIAAGRLKPSAVTEKLIQKRLYQPDMPDVDLFVRSSGEQRTSNFLLWESAYAEFVFLDTLWPDFSRTDLWHAIELYLDRDRRFGGAVDTPEPPAL